jgi:integrase
MSRQTVATGKGRGTFYPTGVPGFEYRLSTDGSTKTFYGSRSRLEAKTFRAARAEWDEKRGKAARGERVIVPSKIKFEAVFEEWYAEAAPGLRSGVAADYRRVGDKILLPEWGHRRIGSFGPADCLRLARTLEQRGLSPSTVANYLKPARGTFAFAVEQEYIAVSPFAQVRRGRLPSCNTTREHREWTTAEVQRLIDAGYALDERPTARADYGLAIEFKMRTGGRTGETLGARYGDVERIKKDGKLIGGVWTITRQWTPEGEEAPPKTSKSKRRVPLTPELVRKIDARKLAIGASDDDYLFASRRGGRPISHTNFRRRGWDLAVENAGLSDGPKVTPHDSRHAFASQMADLGLSSTDAAEVLGHTSSTITERIYTHAFNREQREERVRQAMAQAEAMRG